MHDSLNIGTLQDFLQVCLFFILSCIDQNLVETEKCITFLKKSYICLQSSFYEKKSLHQKNLFCSSPLSRSPWRTVPFGSNVWLRSLPFALFPMCKCFATTERLSPFACADKTVGVLFIHFFCFSFFFKENKKHKNGKICASDILRTLSAIGMMACWWRRVKMRVREWRERRTGGRERAKAKKTGCAMRARAPHD